MEDFRIEKEDTLRHPVFRENDQLSKFDVVIANPPFSLKNWGFENWANDPFGRNFAGVPPKSYGDFAWVQHMIASMAPITGRMGIVLPHGALFRSGAESRIRKHLIDADLLDCVIGLGPNLFYGTGISACIMIFRARKEPQKKTKVLFIDASELYQKGRAQNYFLNEHAKAVIDLYEKYSDVEGQSKIVNTNEIKEKEYNLNISRYVKKPRTDEKIDLKATMEELENAYTEFLKSEDQMRFTAKGGKTALTMTQQELESYLWGAANLLRGVIDPGDYKSIIFPLMFFKRLSDVYDEEYEDALQTYGDEESAKFGENHMFQIPDGSHWKDVRKTATNVGQVIRTAMINIEKANPDKLSGIFGDTNWSNKDRLI